MPRPVQLGRLTHLKSLHLKIYGIYVFPSMAGLTALQRLEMERCRQVRQPRPNVPQCI